MTIYATLSDLQSRHPTELTLLAADEATGLRDDARVEAALADASIEIRGILLARYSAADLASLDQESAELLKIYCMDIALYRVSLSFARSNEAIKERYDASIRRLEAIAAGKGALVSNGGGAGSGTGPDVGSVGQNEVVVVAPERVFSRERLGRI